MIDLVMQAPLQQNLTMKYLPVNQAAAPV